jgi:hypothetical protein
MEGSGDRPATMTSIDLRRMLQVLGLIRAYRDSAGYADVAVYLLRLAREWRITPVPGLGPELCQCHDRGLALPRPWDCVGVTVALGVSSVMVSGLASGRRVRAPLWPILPSTDRRDTSVVSVVLRV